MHSVSKCHNLVKRSEFYMGKLRLNVAYIHNAGWFNRSLQWYSKCYCVARVTKTFQCLQCYHDKYKVIHNFRERCCHLIKNNFGPFGCHHPRSSPLPSFASFSAFLLFLNSSWKSSCLKEFSTVCNSVSITSIVSKWRTFSFIFNRRNREN
jgi:hypothetical protein